jgi:uncharacterized protein YbbC (DUF1343 family)
MRKQIYLLILLFIFLQASCGKSYNLSNGSSKRIILGLENFLDHYADKYKGKRAAVVTNHSGVDFYLQNNINLFREKHIEIALIFAPEHGLYGYQNEYDKQYYIDDDSSNAVIYNLHLLNQKKFVHLLKVADFIIFDMQDMGMRCYTYISSLKFVMDSIAGTNMELVLLDRPNPLGFLYIDGPILEKKFYSKNVSSFPTTLFYNMTIGEAGLYYNGEYLKNVKLTVIPMEGYWREMLYSDTTLPWIPPSPNLPTYISSIIYSAVVLMEGINISVGRGTTKPFEYIGAPWIEPVSFCKGMTELNLKNFAFRPVYFEPTFSKYKNEKCGGVQILYTGGKFSPIEISYKLISYLQKNYEQFQWESHKDAYNIDRLAGTDKFRKAISENIDYKIYSNEMESAMDSFIKNRKRYLIYRDDKFPL